MPLPARPAQRGVAALVAALAIAAPAVMAAAPVATDPMNLCRDAAVSAADRYGIPRAVMLAIATVETRTRREGRTGPWPWTVNVAGQGAWFDSRAAALIHAEEALARGETSVDIGCFQIDYRWHGANFPSLDAMFEPAIAGDYAARFLGSLHTETGDWITASGLYHSRTPALAGAYRASIAAAMGTADGLAGGPPPPIRVAAPAGPARRLRTGIRGASPAAAVRIRVPRGSRGEGVSAHIIRVPPRSR